jgi:hypothetical protein
VCIRPEKIPDDGRSLFRQVTHARCSFGGVGHPTAKKDRSLETRLAQLLCLDGDAQQITKGVFPAVIYRKRRVATEHLEAAFGIRGPLDGVGIRWKEHLRVASAQP